MDSAVLNYQELAKVHENFTFLHFQDVTIYLMGNLPKEQETSISRGTFTQIRRQKNEEFEWVGSS